MTAKIRARQAPAPLERTEQALLVKRLRTDPRTRNLLWTATANGMPARSKASAAMMVGQGLAKGVPDLLFFEPCVTGDCVGLAIEMKRKPNKPTDEQLRWLLELEEKGWETYVAYSAEEAWHYIDDYFGFDGD
jgi:hypothetical protein